MSDDKLIIAAKKRLSFLEETRDKFRQEVIEKQEAIKGLEADMEAIRNFLSNYGGVSADLNKPGASLDKEHRKGGHWRIAGEGPIQQVIRETISKNNGEASIGQIKEAITKSGHNFYFSYVIKEVKSGRIMRTANGNGVYYKLVQ